MYITTESLCDEQFAAGIDTGATRTVLPYKMACLVPTKIATIRTPDGKHEARLATSQVTIHVLGRAYTATPKFSRDRALLGFDILQDNNSDWCMDKNDCYFSGQYFQKQELTACYYLTTTSEAAIPADDNNAPIK